MPHGRSWKVHKPKAFEERVIPQFFVCCKYSSFVRQANGWGFRRMSQGADRNAYYHRYFLRGRSELCRLMKRPGVHQKPPIDPNREPNFYVMADPRDDAALDVLAQRAGSGNRAVKDAQLQHEHIGGGVVVVDGHPPPNKGPPGSTSTAAKDVLLLMDDAAHAPNNPGAAAAAALRNNDVHHPYSGAGAHIMVQHQHQQRPPIAVVPVQEHHGNNNINNNNTIDIDEDQKKPAIIPTNTTAAAAGGGGPPSMVRALLYGGHHHSHNNVNHPANTTLVQQYDGSFVQQHHQLQNCNPYAAPSMTVLTATAAPQQQQQPTFFGFVNNQHQQQQQYNNNTAYTTTTTTPSSSSLVQASHRIMNPTIAHAHMANDDAALKQVMFASQMQMPSAAGAMQQHQQQQCVNVNVQQNVSHMAGANGYVNVPYYHHPQHQQCVIAPMHVTSNSVLPPVAFHHPGQAAAAVNVNRGTTTYVVRNP